MLMPVPRGHYAISFKEMSLGIINIGLAYSVNTEVLMKCIFICKREYEIVVFWLMTPCSDINVLKDHNYLHLYSENGDSITLRNIGIVHHYIDSQAR
jgi:hypothetical protein